MILHSPFLFYSMSEFIEVIGQIAPINNQKFAIADVNDLKGGYIQVDTIAEMNAFLTTNKLKEGMLCYVKNSVQDYHMFQFINLEWIPWVVNGSGGSAILVVETMEDLNSVEYKKKGQLVFINEIDDIRYYNGMIWKSFSKIYIQPTPPQDLSGIWIDTSENREHNSSNTVIQNLLQVISILQDKIKKLEYAFNNQMDFGDFTNNQRHDYDDVTPVEPSYGTSPEEDSLIQNNFIENGINSDIEPTEYNDLVPNGVHLQIKSGTYKQMQDNKNDFLPKELLWCYDTQQLWIKDPKTYKLIQIGSAGTQPPVEPPTDEIMEGILTELVGSKNKIIGIEFADMSNKDNTYLIQVNDGKLDIVDKQLDLNNLANNAQNAGNAGYYTDQYFPIAPADVGSTLSPKIYINSVYSGGAATKTDYNPVSHNFVELSNLGKKDLNLKGLYLHYTEGDLISGTYRYWVTLPLRGVIKAQSSFLIRGHQCSVIDVNTTLIKVGTPDIEWTKSNSYNYGVLDDPEQNYTIWGSDNLIKFSNNCSFYISGEESTNYFKDNVLSTTAPYSALQVQKWYVDLVGFGAAPGGLLPSESSAFAAVGNNSLLMRYYNMDPVLQATKALSARKNSTDWTYINLANVNPLINIQDYTPKASFENKNIFFNKNKLKPGIPNIVTCSFGYNAHTTRCFNWVSVGYYDEFIMFRKEGESYTDVNKKESFKAGDNRAATNNRNNSIYNRIRSITTDGTAFTTHKIILDFPEPLTYEKYYYKVGREGYWTDERSFILKGRDHVINTGYNFIQFSDQQGFNNEEYQTMKVTNNFIQNDKANVPFDFIINVGDATQNGNRINEWIDYFDASNQLFKEVEQMYSVGNNDLCPLDVYQLGYGEDMDKNNPINVNYFFTNEHPFEIPTSSMGVYVPSVYSFIYGNTYFLSMNSEITETARTSIFLDIDGVNVYDNLKTWAQNDLTHIASDSKIAWKISLTHEAPFTIITPDLILKYNTDTTTTRGGSHLNTVGNYWYSQFLQDNKFHLNICGHKHTFSNSRYIREDVTKTMTPIVYDTSATPSWYTNLAPMEQKLCQISTDNSQHYVKYVMSQAGGYKLVSNKELPAKNIPWLLSYYPNKNNTAVGVSPAVDKAQQYPNYIAWNIGSGNESESGTVATPRPRILGKSYKLIKTDKPTENWTYKYNTPVLYTELSKAGGNGSITPNNNIIVEKLFA